MPRAESAVFNSFERCKDIVHRYWDEVALCFIETEYSEYLKMLFYVIGYGYHVYINSATFKILEPLMPNVTALSTKPKTQL